MKLRLIDTKVTGWLSRTKLQQQHVTRPIILPPRQAYVSRVGMAPAEHLGRMGEPEQAREHLTTATTMCREMGRTYRLERQAVMRELA
jgi:hypothetical protein